MFILPVEIALRIYGAIAHRSEAKGTREQLSTHLMKLYIDGERNEHLLTVHGLTYLRGHRQQRLKIIESFSEFGCRQRLFAQVHAPDSNGNPARKSVDILLRELEGVLGRLASAGRTAANALRGTAGRTEQESEPNPLKVNHRHRANGHLRATG